MLLQTEYEQIILKIKQIQRINYETEKTKWK
jgi:hypothetical protein